jgi:hypothetical protein
VVVTVYAGRRTPDVAVAAEGFARALRASCAPQPVAVFLDNSAASPSRRHADARPLPLDIKRVTERLGPREHAVLGVVGPVTEQVLTAFDLSVSILLVTDGSVASLRAAQRALRLCRDVGYADDRVLAVLMTDGSNDGVIDAAQVLKREVAVVSPAHDREAEPYRVLALPNASP